MIVTFPDGSWVQATGAGRPEDDPTPDFGLYLDGCWAGAGDWERELLDWPDYGLPADTEVADRAIEGAFDRARSGERVEVGCVGGIGRTGTVLACMAILAGVAAVDARAWVRANYRADAVETEPQHAFVLEFGDRHDR